MLIVKQANSLFFTLIILSFIFQPGCSGSDEKVPVQLAFNNPLALTTHPDGKYALVSNANFQRLQNGSGFISILCTDPFSGRGFNKIGNLGEELQTNFMIGETVIDNKHNLVYLADRIGDSLQVLELADLAESLGGDICEKAALFHDLRETHDYLSSSRKPNEMFSGYPARIGRMNLYASDTKMDFSKLFESEVSSDILPYSLTLIKDPQDASRDYLYIAGMESGKIYLADLASIGSSSDLAALRSGNKGSLNKGFITLYDDQNDVIELELNPGISGIAGIPELNLLFVTNWIFGDIGVNQLVTTNNTGQSYHLHNFQDSTFIEFKPAYDSYQTRAVTTAQFTDEVNGETMHRVYIATRNPDQILIIDPEPLLSPELYEAESAIIGSIESDSQPSDIVVQQGEHLFIANYRANTVMKIDIPSNQLLKTYQVGQGPYSLAITPKNPDSYISPQFLYSSNFLDHSVSVLDLQHDRIIQRIPDSRSVMLALCNPTKPASELSQCEEDGFGFSQKSTRGEIVEFSFVIEYYQAKRSQSIYAKEEKETLDFSVSDKLSWDVLFYDDTISLKKAPQIVVEEPSTKSTRTARALLNFSIEISDTENNKTDYSTLMTIVVEAIDEDYRDHADSVTMRFDISD